MAYTPEERETMFSKVVKAIQKGASLRSALKLPDTPSADTFVKWCDNDAKFAERYTRATKMRAEIIFEDILNIADENYKDTYVDSEGLERTDHDVIQRSKLRVDARKWVLAKMHPTKYGDKIDVTTDGAALGTPPIIGMVIKNETPADEPSDDDLF